MSKDTVRMALHNPAAWPGSRTDDADEVIALRGELAAALAKLDAANERARGMAIDLRRYALMNDRQARVISQLNHTNDELRYQMRLAARADRGDAGHKIADGAGLDSAFDDMPRLTKVLKELFPNAEATIADAAKYVNRHGYVGFRPFAVTDDATLTLTDRGDGADGYGVMPNE